MLSALDPLLSFHPEKDLREGHIFLLDKPLGWTSFNVVGKVRHLLRHHLSLARIKVGHAGTLDPLATGLLVVCVGRATRLAAELTGQDKEYEAEFTLGATTPSHDLETEVETVCEVGDLPLERLDEALRGLSGEMMQRPPQFSAKRVGGKRAYHLARRGEAAELDPVPVNVRTFERLSYSQGRLRARIECSKGTYVRALARDLGQALGCGAYLSALRRTRSGDLRVEKALTIPQLEQLIQMLETPRIGA